MTPDMTLRSVSEMHLNFILAYAVSDFERPVSFDVDRNPHRELLS